MTLRLHTILKNAKKETSFCVLFPFLLFLWKQKLSHYQGVEFNTFFFKKKKRDHFFAMNSEHRSTRKSIMPCKIKRTDQKSQLKRSKDVWRKLTCREAHQFMTLCKWYIKICNKSMNIIIPFSHELKGCCEGCISRCHLRYIHGLNKDERIKAYSPRNSLGQHQIAKCILTLYETCNGHKI